MSDNNQYNPEHLYQAVIAAYEAGLAIMDIYSGNFSVEFKKDNSPLTVADRKAHDIISKQLESTGIPILSEEGKEIPFETRKAWNTFWLVDPLDGTKEFVNRNGDFTVNIALIHHQKPIAGVIYTPVTMQMYFAAKEIGAYKLNMESLTGMTSFRWSDLMYHAGLIPPDRMDRQYIVVASRSHLNNETTDYIDKIKKYHPGLDFLSRGSSLKFCAIAEGTADYYPRMGPTMEWDTAAGHAICECAGFNVMEMDGRTPLLYNKDSLLNPYFQVGKLEDILLFNS